jgi:hypothetical protein
LPTGSPSVSSRKKSSIPPDRDEDEAKSALSAATQRRVDNPGCPQIAGPFKSVGESLKLDGGSRQRNVFHADSKGPQGLGNSAEVVQVPIPWVAGQPLAILAPALARWTAQQNIDSPPRLRLDIIGIHFVQVGNYVGGFVVVDAVCLGSVFAGVDQKGHTTALPTPERLDGSRSSCI